MASQGLPLHRGEPEVPYLKTLAPAVYELFSIDGHLRVPRARRSTRIRRPVIEAGTCADDWLKRVGGDAFSLVCELPYYTSPGARRHVARRRHAAATRCSPARARELALHRRDGARASSASRTACPDHRLTRSVRDYLAKAPKRLAAERANAGTAEYARAATRAEAAGRDGVQRLLPHALPGRGAPARDDGRRRDVADAIRARLEALAAEVERASDLRVLPLRPLVAVQAGAGLLALADGDEEA